MKRILIYAPTAPGSGVTQFLLNTLSRLEPGAFHIDVASFRNPRLRAWTEAHGGRYTELDVSLYKHPVLFKRQLLSLFAGQDTVHFHLSAVSTLRPFRYARRAGVKRVLLHTHSTDMDLTSPLRRKVFGALHRLLRGRLPRYADVLLACSADAAKWLFGKRAAGRAIIIPNGVDLEVLRFTEATRQALRDELSLGDAFVVGHVGRFMYSKNHAFLLDVFAEIARSRPDARLMLIGEGEGEDAIRDKAAALGLTDRILFPGFREDVSRFYAAMDVFAFPSRFEGFSLVLVEAMAAGLPCFITKDLRTVPGTDLIHFLSLEETPATWASRILAANTAERPDTHAILTAAGFNLQQTADTLASLY